MEEFDFIIVGAGTAGCVLARRILEKTAARVLLVEAGPPYPAVLLDPPLPGMKFGRGFSWRQASIPQPRLGGRIIEWPMGKVVGGTSSVNAMMGYLGNAENFDAWKAAGNPGWSAQDLAPYFQRVFGIHPDEPFRWESGQTLSLSEHRFSSRFSEAFLDACVQDGMQKESPLVGREDGRCGYFPVLQRDCIRFESAKGYLAPVKSHPHLSLKTGIHVRRVLIENSRAVGIEVSRDGRFDIYRAARGVIVCAGVFQTPRILQCSGVGPAKVLREAGIHTLVDLPAVGENFHDHVRVGLLHQSGRVSPGSKRYWIPGILRYLWRRDGVMASNCCESGAFVCSREDLRVPDIEMITHFQTFGPKDEVDIEVCLVSPKSRGRVFIDPRNPFGMPLVDANFLAHEEDVAALVAGIRRARSVAARPALQNFPLLKETSPGTTVRNEAALRAAILREATTAYHPCGSCAMGSSGALGPDLRVHGTDALWVADASAMPSSPNGNIACSVIVLAEKASDLIAGSTR
jgi:choline dehydrogenase